MKTLLRAAALLAPVLLSIAPAQAQIWPARPVKIVVSQAAGGTPDILCRLLADKLGPLLGQQIVVENRPGGANVVGASAAAHAPALAVSWAKRMPQFPQVASIAETNPGVELSGWFMIVAPAGTPADMVKRVNQEMDKVLKTPEVASRLMELGFFTEGADTPEGARKFVQTQYELWGKVTREIGLQPE